MFEAFFGKHITAVYISIIRTGEEERGEMKGGGGRASAQHRGMQTLLANCILCLSAVNLAK